ncbi:PAS domain-containing protein [Leptospira sp. 96542]|nr:PAS domain-containing protein [Leptospira sp. 96542]
MDPFFASNDPNLEVDRAKSFVTLAERLWGIGFWEHDLEKKITRVSGAMLSIFGETSETGEFEAGKLRIHPDDQTRFNEHISNGLKNKEMGEIEYKILTKFDEVRILNLRSEVQLGEDGEPKKLMGVVRDVTEVRRMEGLIRRKLELEYLCRDIHLQLTNSDISEYNDVLFDSLQKIGSFLGAVRVVLVKYDIPNLNRTIISEWINKEKTNTNSVLNQTFGIDENSPIIKKKLSGLICRIHLEDQNLGHYDKLYLEILGGNFFLSAPIFIDKQIFGAIGVIFNNEEPNLELQKVEDHFISQLSESFKYAMEKNFEAIRLAKEKDLLTSIMDVSSTAITVLSTDGKIQYANHSAEKVLGIKLSDILDRAYDSPEWRNTSLDGGPWLDSEQPFNIVLNTGRPVTDIRHAIQDAKGNQKYLSINGSPVLDRDGNVTSLVFLITDISENVIKEKALISSELKYRTITELTLSMVYELDVETGINHWAGAIEELTGFTYEEYLNVGFDVWAELIHPSDKERVLDQINTCMKDHTKFACEYRYRTKSGEYIYIEDNGIFIYDQNGVAKRMFGAMINRTERKNSELALTESESRLRLALDSAKMGVWSWDLVNEEIYWSPRSYEILGRSKDNFDGSLNQLFGFIVPQDRLVLLRTLGSFSVGQDRTDYFVQIRIYLTNGIIRWIESKGRLTRDKDGKPTRLMGVLSDITEIKQSEEALKSSEERFETFYQFSNEAILFFKESGLGITDANVAFQRLFGYNDYDIPNLKFKNLITRDSLNRIRNMLKEDSINAVDIVGIKKTGELFPAIISRKKFTYRGEKHIIYSVIDTSSLKEVEQLRNINNEINIKNKLIERQKNELEETLDTLKKAQSQLIQSEKLAALGQLIAGIAHEINNPIGAVKASNQNMLDWQKRYGLTSQLFREAILSVSEKEQRLVKQLLKKMESQLDFYTGKEERTRKKQIKDLLLGKNFPLKLAEGYAETWVELGIGNLEEAYIPIFESEYIRVYLDYLTLESQFRRNNRSIQLAVDRVSKIMYALKNFSHFDLMGKKTNTNIPETIELVLTIYQNQLKKGIELTKDFDSVSPIDCYPDDLLHVWTNLIYNSLQAMSFKGKLKLSVKENETDVIVSVADSGPGIPYEIQSKIFEPFFTTKPTGEGSGLGLDIVNKIIKKHNGKIELDSVPGKTIFKIFLPK